jgi:hypothetical protein
MTIKLCEYFSLLNIADQCNGLQEIFLRKAHRSSKIICIFLVQLEENVPASFGPGPSIVNARVLIVE